MSESVSNSFVNRRSALAVLGAGGLGLAITSGRHEVNAQEVTPEMATHPVVGLWQNAVSGPDAAKMPWTFSVYHADGTYHEWNGLDAGAALGIWRPTGERSADLLFIYQDTDPTTDSETPGTATFHMVITADDSGNLLTAEGDLDLRTPDGSSIAAIPDFSWTSQRITFDWNPATGSTATGTATPTS